MMYEATGKVIEVGNTQSFGTNGFTKREVVVEVGAEDSKWKNTVPFTFTKDRTSLLDGIKAGMQVNISFDIGGRAWEDKKTGNTRYFVSLNGIRIEDASHSGKGGVPAPATPTSDDYSGAGDDPDDLPF